MRHPRLKEPNEVRPGPNLTPVRKSILVQMIGEESGTFHHWASWVRRELNTLSKMNLTEEVEHPAWCKCESSNHWRLTNQGEAEAELHRSETLRQDKLIFNSGDF
jgi:hypothetical protein